jgi:hypothetical protein
MDDTIANLPPISCDVQVTVLFQPAAQPVNLSSLVIFGKGFSSTDWSLSVAASSLGVNTL